MSFLPALTWSIGVLTVCGHKYCTDCLRYWWRAHRTCPICKRPLKLRDFHQITYNPQQLVAQEEDNIAKFDHERPSKNAIYSDISSGLLNQIKTIDLDDSFGTKIDTLARHIIWLREHDPGAKSIVFSQYKNFLTILQRAFQRLKIVSTRVDVPGGIERFKRDPAVPQLTETLNKTILISLIGRVLLVTWQGTVVRIDIDQCNSCIPLRTVD